MFHRIQRRHGKLMSKGNGGEGLIRFACILNILGLVLIMVAIFKLTPITLVVSITFGGILIAFSLVLYIFVVIRDLRARGVI
jgi:hypothetical protein